MKVFIVLASCLVVALAKPSFYGSHPLYYSAGAPYHYAAYAAPVYASQHHSQDQFGQYNYGYSGGPSAKTETRTFDGVVRGSYSYVDTDNKLQTIDYTAGPEGFKAAGTNLPQAPIDNGVAPSPVTDTPEVVAARAEHLAAIEKAKQAEAAAPPATEAPAPVVPEAAPLEAPKPVEDTEEVKAARAEHLAAVEEEKKLQALVKSQTIEIVAPEPIKYTYAAAPLKYTYAAAPVVSHASYAYSYPAYTTTYKTLAHQPWTNSYPYASYW